MLEIIKRKLPKANNLLDDSFFSEKSLDKILL